MKYLIYVAILIGGGLLQSCIKVTPHVIRDEGTSEKDGLNGDDDDDGELGDGTAKTPRKCSPTRSKMEKYLQSYGYTTITDRYLNQDQFEQALRRFGNLNGLPMKKHPDDRSSLVAAKKLLKKFMVVKRCGDPDLGTDKFSFNHISEVDSGGRRRKRYVPHAPWGSTQLTYKIVTYSNKLPHSVQEAELDKAAAMWAQHVPWMTLDKLQGSGTPDITIEFLTGEHNCPQAFDGPGLIVAHAYYPEDGRIHLDDDDDFTATNEPNKKSLVSVFAHELGHALGLKHSSHGSAVMYHSFQTDTETNAIHDDDVIGIQYLYPEETPECLDHQSWCIPDFISVPEDCNPDVSNVCQVLCGVCQP